MQRLEVSGAVRPLQWSLGVKGLKKFPSRCVSVLKTPLRNNFCSFTTSQTGAK